MKGYKVILGLIALGFAAGMFGGYRIWGTIDKGKTDIKQLLQQLNQEVDLLESKNRELTESLEASGNPEGESGSQRPAAEGLSGKTGMG